MSDHATTFQTAREDRDSAFDSSHSTPVSARCVKCREVRTKETYTDTDLSRSFRHVCHSCQTATWWNVLRVLDEDNDDPELVTDGGAVTCWICGDTIPADESKDIDISPDDEYYPNMRSVCPTHGGRSE